VTATWPDGRTVTYAARELTGDADLIPLIEARRGHGPIVYDVSDHEIEALDFTYAAACLPRPEFDVDGVAEG
jgi:hypothetical protein